MKETSTRPDVHTAMYLLYIVFCNTQEERFCAKPYISGEKMKILQNVLRNFTQQAKRWYTTKDYDSKMPGPEMVTFLFVELALISVCDCASQCDLALRWSQKQLGTFLPAFCLQVFTHIMFRAIEKFKKSSKGLWSDCLIKSLLI